MSSEISVVIDTNIFVSAILRGGIPLTVIEITRSGSLKMLVSEPILEEMLITLSRPKFAKNFDKLALTPVSFIDKYKLSAQLISPQPIVDCPIKDPKDLKFIECAVAGGASYVVSGDHHLLDLKVYENIPILTPAQFLAILTPPDEPAP